MLVSVNLLKNTPSTINPTSSQEEDYKIDGTNKKTLLKPADIAGSDLYSEQINVYLAGNKSIIQQSLFTNDTNIIPQFDTNDPAFYKCNFFICASNGIQPEIFPAVLTETDLKFPSIPNMNGFTGFLYYDEDVGKEEIQWRAERALDIIKNKFQIDLILLKTNKNNFFPFVGYYPQWDSYLDKLTENFPMDGYWQALNLDRLENESYYKHFHLSSYFLMINSLDFLNENKDLSTYQLNFNLDDFGISLLQSSNTSQFLNLLTGDNASSSSQQQIQLAEDSHYTLIQIQYEGLKEGIDKIAANQYEFNLWDTLGYDGDSLAPSEKIYIALMGAFMSQINVHILCTEILDMTPKLFEFSDYLLDKIQEITSLVGMNDFDVNVIKNYNLKLYWNSVEGMSSIFMLPIDKEDPTDIINAIQLTGVEPFSSIPTGILNPIDDFKVKYRTSGSEPQLLVTKIMPNMNASYGINRDFNFNITLSNVGTEDAWGIPTPYLLDLVNLHDILGDTLYDDLWESVQKYFDNYDSLEEFMNLDEPPRLFYIDALGTGVVDSYYPALTPANIYPYSENMDELIDYIREDNPALYAALYPFRNTFNNNNSIWNDDNWVIKPGENVTISPANVSLADSSYDTYTKIYECNFLNQTRPFPTPELVIGTSIDNTNSTSALTTDGIGWNISSEKYYGNEELNVIFVFENQTHIDLVNNTLEGMNIIINFTNEVSLANLSLTFEIFNFTSEQFEPIPSGITTLEDNKTLTISFLKHNDHLKWVHNKDTPQNNTVILRMSRTDTEKFEISIDEVDLTFLKSEINVYNVSRTRVLFSGEKGYTYYSRRSNSVKVSNYDMASLIATSELKYYNPDLKQVNEYSLTLQNIGSNIARNVSVSILVPGIIENAKNFTVHNDYLYYNISSLGPSEEKIVNFTFYTPNSGSINEAKITFYNDNLIDNINGTSLYVHSNEVFFNAPVDYIKKFPYLRIVEIFYNTSTGSPKLDQRFTLYINVKNTAKGTTIPEIKMMMGDMYEGLFTTSSYLTTIEHISYNQIKSTRITLAKTSWKGYYYPAINFLGGNESRTVQIFSSDPITLGKIQLSLNKTIDKAQAAVDDIITVLISIKNVGTININNFLLSDALSFGEESFGLIEGKLVNNFSVNFEPGQVISFSYKIRAKTQVAMNLTGAFIDYYFLFKEQISSNEVPIKIVAPRIYQLFYILIPSIISVGVLSVYYRYTSKYKKDKYEIMRAEEGLFELNSLDAILKVEHTLRERLNILHDIENRGEEGGELNA